MLNQVYRLVAARQFEVQTVEELMTPTDIVVRPTYLSLCHADQRYFTGNRAQTALRKKLPMALIHEGIGTVVSDPQGDFQPGDRVAMVPNTPTTTNQIVKENYLPSSKFRSSGYDGFMQEYVCLQRDRVLKIPANFNSEMSAFLEMVSVGVQALTQLKQTMDADQRVLGIWGDGNLGYITATLAKTMFADSQVIVLGRHQDKLDYFSFVDATYLVDEIPADLQISQAVECTGGLGSEQAIAQIIDHLHPMGTAILMGVSEEPIDINTRMVLERGLTLQGSSRSGRQDFETAIDLLSHSDVTRERLQNLIGVTGTVQTLADVTAFFEQDLANYWGKAVMRWAV
ncbi:ribitol-5-phosphate dehydrogenase [Lactobacillus sp.] [Lactiplantibacillus mudanjiangensis]|uniref:ribitol-5-phosphate dehydrogenase n=1 Tax=Lactiplantibacillus mudanjiangensis TaxID=1296538 RepID=UPI0010149011|nr:ribitol-5-phosphate dehydrogenase [Lactiplantibacillus mudanjiangensis]VDG30885.1 ribitol-5-phosphate dehydrogenase [Lactobacillus sp.] [Lactiplantibacillus mudanjiangensis]